MLRDAQKRMRSLVEESKDEYRKTQAEIATLREERDELRQRLEAVESTHMTREELSLRSLVETLRADLHAAQEVAEEQKKKRQRSPEAFFSLDLDLRPLRCWR
jgi:chromosome segregation ATPase